MKKNKIFLISILIFLISFAQQALSQTTGKIAGQVYDKKNNEPLAGANVFLEGTTLGASTDLEGSFFIINVPPGTYTVTVQIIGYKSMKVEKLRVSVNRTSYIDAALSEALLEGEEIVVQADKMASKKDQTGSMKAISSDQIEALPVENINDVVALQAGVVNGHFRGGRSNEVTYLVDGVQVDDVYGGETSSITIEADAVADLEVITGNFNAEYGRAMSGVVNAVTKDGDEDLKVSASVNSGTYLTPHSNIFIGLDEIDIFRNTDYRFSVSGPILKNKLYYYFNTRYQDNKNHLNAIRRFNVDDFSNFQSVNPEEWYSEATGDGAYVPMNYSKNLSFLGKLTYKFSSSLKTSLMYTRNDDEWRGYSHVFKYDPDGLGSEHHNADLVQLQLNHMLSTSAFYQFTVSRIRNYYGSYLYKNPKSDKYIHDRYLSNADNTGFFTGGQSKNHEERVVDDLNAKFDLTWQINKHHSIKTGVLYIGHAIDNKNRPIQNYYRNQSNVDSALIVDGKVTFPYYKADVLSDTSTVSDIYKVSPYEIAAYLQDKMEYEDMVINLGLRFDYFDPNTVYPSDLRNPDNSVKNAPYSSYPKADKKIQISPRLGLSYQLGRRAVLRFSYGHFFQLPPMYAMFQNHSFRVAPADFQTSMGNPQLNAQKTVQYELGLWQELSDELSFEIALYYRDIYDLLSVSVIQTYNAVEYGLYSNKDYGNTKGLELKLDYGYSDWFASVNYTLQYTRGNADNPFQTFNRLGQSQDPVNRIIVMSWDQRHTFNTTVGYHHSSYGVTATASYNSGTPYTWSPIGVNPLINLNLPPNNDYTPAKFNIDLHAFYGLQLTEKIKLNFELRVFNLLDRLNEYGVNPLTGRTYTTVVEQTDVEGHRSNFNDYLDRIHDPSGYSAPRFVKFGMGVSF